MSLQKSYTFFAPVYDALIQKTFASVRASHLQVLNTLPPKKILLIGIGTGLDIPYLAPQHQYYGIDITRAMLSKAQQKHCTHPHIQLALQQGDAMQLPYPDQYFDIIIMHLILVVVPYPSKALQEAYRVLKATGNIAILDKFLHPQQVAPLRRIISPLLGKLATRTDVELEPLLHTCPQLIVSDDQPVLAKGWFRYLTLQKSA